MASQITSLTIVYSTVYSRRRAKKTSKLCVTGLCARNSPVTGEFPAQRASNAENASIWRRRHEIFYLVLLWWLMMFGKFIFRSVLTYTGSGLFIRRLFRHKVCKWGFIAYATMLQISYLKKFTVVMITNTKMLLISYYHGSVCTTQCGLVMPAVIYTAGLTLDQLATSCHFWI